MITYTIECRDAKHAAEIERALKSVELAIKSAELIKYIDKNLEEQSSLLHHKISGHQVRVGLRAAIREVLKMEPKEFGLPDV
jgi:ribosomal protein L25 (general stress protein Ctc)